jgi:hypothetical protein
MIAVAAVAVALWIKIEAGPRRQRRDLYLVTADYFAMEQRIAHQMSLANPGALYPPKLEAYYAALSQKYKLAATRPWQIAPPDPPPPPE